MKFSVMQNNLEQGLQKIIGAVSTRAPIPSISNVFISLKDNVLNMTATDLEITITSYVELIEFEGSGEVLIQAKRLQEIVSALPNVQLNFDVQSGFRVQLNVENLGVFHLPGGDPVNFPDTPSVEPKVSYRIPADRLRRMISKTIFAVSKDEMRAVLTGILFQVRPGELRLVATDGYRLSKISHSDINIEGEIHDDIIPMKALNILYKNTEDSEEIEVILSDRRAAFITEKQKLITRLIDGSYPKYENIIPRNNPNELSFLLSDFMPALKRAAVFATPPSFQVKLKLEATKAVIESEDYDYGGSALVEVPVEYNGEPMEMGYNANFLNESLRQIDTERAVITLLSANDAALITPENQRENEDFLMLLMPIRLR